MSHTRQEQMEAFGRFLDILDELRVKCPWDRKQTNESLRPNTIEETYELCDALMRDDKKDICKELGDVLLHVAFYAKIGSETGDFDIKDVCDKLCDKLIFRHPHVFGEVMAETAGQVSENWEQLKLKEKDGNKSVLSGVPAALPSLIKAYRIQDKARNVGFDWEEREQVWDKVKEEIGEFQEEVANMDKDKAEAEFGDVMFSLINAARLYKINPDNALERLREHTPKRMVVLAPTGIAAINAGGVTIHSFFQISFAPFVPETTFNSAQIQYRYSQEKRNIIRSMDLLVIDEISMVRADLLDAVDATLRRYRNREKPFGGVQLLMIGDLHQLAPVVRDSEWS